jgi:hypothetical protein
MCAAIGMVGCAEETNGVVGWWRGAASSGCMCPAAAPECNAGDCELISVRGLAADGSYLEGVVMTSAKARTMTVVQMFHGDYALLGDEIQFVPDEGRSFVSSISREGDRLTLNHVVHDRAPDWLAAALESNAGDARSK